MIIGCEKLFKRFKSQFDFSFYFETCVVIQMRLEMSYISVKLKDGLAKKSR